MSKRNDGFGRVNCCLKNVMALPDCTYCGLFTGLHGGGGGLTRFKIPQTLLALCNECNWQISL